MGRYGLSLLEAKRTTLKDLEIYKKAYRVQDEDRTRRIAMQAWFNQTVQATKKVGKDYRSVYKGFDDFYNHEQAFKAIFMEDKKVEPVNRPLTLADRNRMMNKRRKED